MSWRIIATDPMLRMLVLAVVLASVLPAGGAARGVAGTISNTAVFVLFLLNGMRIPRSKVLGGLVNWRFLLPLVLWTFGAMALLGSGVAFAAGSLVSPLLAVGFLYLGTLPSTVQSATSYTTLAGGNAALSVVSAALLNILGMVLTVPVFLALGGAGEGALSSDALVKIMGILVLPFILGQLVQDRARRFVDGQRSRIVWLDRAIIAGAVYVALSAAVDEGIGSRIGAGEWLAVLGLVAAMLGLAHGGAWALGGVLGLARPDRVAFLFAGAQKSAAVGAPLASILFEPGAAGLVVVPLLLYHFFQLVLAAPLASRLAATPLRDGDGCTGPTTTATGR